MKSLNSFLAGLLAGAVIGGALALLYAPASGRETREHLRKKLEDLEKEFETLKGSAAGKTEKIRKDIAGKLADLKREIDEMAGSVS
jgi:gas vesicle protein